jgi:putative transcription factor
MICEMCGADEESLTLVNVEGSLLRVCSSCARFGKPVGGATPSVREEPEDRADVAGRLKVARGRGLERDLFADLPERELDPEWSRKVRQVREKLGLTQEQFGQRINEKTSVVHKLESGALEPSDQLVRKIERTFKVRLTLREPPAS